MTKTELAKWVIEAKLEGGSRSIAGAVRARALAVIYNALKPKDEAPVTWGEGIIVEPPV